MELKEILHCSVVEADEFTRQLFKILDTVDEEGVSQVANNIYNTYNCNTCINGLQETSFCIYRSDYMIESRPEVCHSLTRMKQTEVNTIACALGTLADRFPQLHRSSSNSKLTFEVLIMLDLDM